ncbi:MAG TPA: hypothetical protein VJY33_16590 [Isosphaeraceae bacterium]|nr:hypothetical protein [Isosphaeraceae bacterium]
MKQLGQQPTAGDDLLAERTRKIGLAAPLEAALAIDEDLREDPFDHGRPLEPGRDPELNRRGGDHVGLPAPDQERVPAIPAERPDEALEHLADRQQ